jgi:protein-S-isoprenylcysteine O-methyltransferase Ste14
MVYRILFPLLWLAFIVFWIVMARGGKAVAEREDLYSRLSHYAPLAVAVYLLVAPDGLVPVLNNRFAPLCLELVQFGAALTVIGIAFALWARLRLAGNWSSDVTLKRDHELIVDGPYRWVRHPIYTGMGVAWWRKLTIGEIVMRRQFGDAYVHYAERTRALIPFVL